VCLFAFWASTDVPLSCLPSVSSCLPGSAYVEFHRTPEQARQVAKAVFAAKGKRKKENRRFFGASVNVGAPGARAYENGAGGLGDSADEAKVLLDIPPCGNATEGPQPHPLPDLTLTLNE
jgi:hypothetical protein